MFLHIKGDTKFATSVGDCGIENVSGSRPPSLTYDRNSSGYKLSVT